MTLVPATHLRPGMALAGSPIATLPAPAKASATEAESIADTTAGISLRSGWLNRRLGFASEPRRWRKRWRHWIVIRRHADVECEILLFLQSFLQSADAPAGNIGRTVDDDAAHSACWSLFKRNTSDRQCDQRFDQLSNLFAGHVWPNVDYGVKIDRLSLAIGVGSFGNPFLLQRLDHRADGFRPFDGGRRLNDDHAWSCRRRLQGYRRFVAVYEADRKPRLTDFHSASRICNCVSTEISSATSRSNVLVPLPASLTTTRSGAIRKPRMALNKDVI